MIECNINNIKKSFGANDIFENVSFDIKTGERIGLIGPNGCGKTTIMKILIGEEHVQEGEVTFRKGTKLGYLDQIPVFDDHTTVLDILQSGKEEVFTLKKEIDYLTEQLNHVTGEELEQALTKYSYLIHDFEQQNGYLIETDINMVCSGLKISDEMRTMPFHVLSGGEKTRVMLGKILLEHPTILMLDEPSNHLDLESIEWLEGYLKSYDGSVLVVSHDRYFLDNVCQKIVELTPNRAIIYHGNYSYYVIERERRFLLELKVYLAQERKIKRMEDQIERYRIWGRMRDSDKMFKRAKELERRLEKIERLDKPVKDNPKMKMNKSSSGRSGKRVLEANHIHKAYGDLLLLDNAKIHLIYQDRLAILGQNGSGKTTLINLLLEDREKEDTDFKWGTKLNVGYLPQEVHFDNENQSVIEYFTTTHQVNQNEARKELAKALFVRDDVFKKIKNLSGGEKSKLTLCSLTYNKANFMILDEPTNHLDIDSREILEEMLLAFDGTILFISHDRYFIKKIANRIGEIEEHNITYYEGDYEYYRLMKSRRDKEVKKPVADKKKKKTIKKEKKRNIAQELEDVEYKLKEVELAMNNNAFDSEKLLELHMEKEQLENKLESLYEEWDEDNE